LTVSTADLDVDFDVEAFSGFLPCKYDGKPGGFEYFADAPSVRTIPR
jgi:hypothetical protein